MNRRPPPELFGLAMLALLAGIIIKVIFFPANAEEKAATKARAEQEEIEEAQAKVARIACTRYAKSIANHPSTVKVLATKAEQSKTEGYWIAAVQFTAKNSFNMEATYTASCVVKDGEVIDGQANEI